MRLADRAWRLAPDNAEITHLYGRLLLNSGETASALRLLRKSASDRPDPDTHAAIIEALVTQSEFGEAVEHLNWSLRRFAVKQNTKLATSAGRLIRRADSKLSGWVGITPDLELFGEISCPADERAVTVIVQEHYASGRHAAANHKFALDRHGIARLNLVLGDQRLSRSCTISVFGTELAGSGLDYPPEYGLDGRATIENGRVVGWAAFDWAPYQQPDLLVRDRAGTSIRVAASPDATRFARHGFSFDLSEQPLKGAWLHISALLPGAVVALPDTPLLLRPSVFRPKRALPTANVRKHGRLARPDIAVIVPVYRGTAETLACLASLRRTIEPGTEIIVIDDASPEPALADALDALAASGSITLLRNKRNEGFPRSVNSGLRRAGDRDVVVLNADVVVFDGWLERLREAAYSAPLIGTVTPLTSSGSIASYPAGNGGDLDDAAAAAIDLMASKVNAGLTIEVPTGVGFCLYIRAACLHQVGTLDTRYFSRGYGEENDFCLRATRLSWKHVIAGNVFVRHIGNVSFGKQRHALMERNTRILNARHPGYDEEIRQFLTADPVAKARRRLDEARLKSTAKQERYVIIVTLALSGGVSRNVRDRADRLKEAGLTPLMIQPRAGGCVLLKDERDFLDLSYRLPAELDTVASLLKGLSIDHIELHHFLDLDASVIETVLALGAPYDIYVHDYAWLCPRLTLLGGNGRYCGEPDLAGCEACIETHGSSLHEVISVAQLRERSARWLSSARQLFAPTHDVSERFKRYFSAIQPIVEPWEPARKAKSGSLVAAADGTIRVAVIGAIGDQKGYQVILDCAGDVSDRDLPLEFVIIGFSQDNAALTETGKVFITGKFDDAEIIDLIARQRPQIAFFPSVTPETWCYALTHALDAGLPVAAFDLGAIAERLRGAENPFRLLSIADGASKINDSILDFWGEVRRFALDESSLAMPQSKVSGGLTPLRAVGASGPALILRKHSESASDGRTLMQSTSSGLAASAELLTLPSGLYLFSVRSAAPAAFGEVDGVILPALQVAPAPGSPNGEVEIIAGPRNQGSWLYDTRDTLVVKVTEPASTLLITSLRTAGEVALQVEIQRLDSPASKPPPAISGEVLSKPADPARISATAAQLPPLIEPEDNQVRLKIVAHIQNRGDVTFVGTTGAGIVGEKLWIESFSVVPVDRLRAGQIEYKGLTLTGVETPWVSDGAPCGTRGMGIPLIGFAIRIKSGTGAEMFDCEYGASFVSGAAAGPLKNGAPCCAPTADDPLTNLRLSIRERQRTTADPSPDDPAPEIEHQTVRKTKASSKQVGPRFGIFRETEEHRE